MKVKNFLSPISLKIGSVVVHTKLIFLHFQKSAGQNFYGCLRGVSGPWRATRSAAKPGRVAMAIASSLLPGRGGLEA